MATILSIRAIGNGEYKFTCLTNVKKNVKKNKGIKFNFTIYPQSCCPQYFGGHEEVYPVADANTWNKIPDLDKLVKIIIDDKVLEYMNNMQYNPHDDDHAREKYKIISSFFSSMQPESYDFRNKTINLKTHKKNYKILTSKKNFDMSKLDLTDFKLFQ